MKAEIMLSILATSDIHGHIFPYLYGTGENAEHGLGKLAALIKKEREQSEISILIDNGDLIQGTPLTYYYSRYLSSQKNPMIQILNKLEYDAAVVGNHEFNYGKSILARAVSESNFPWLAANILFSSTKETYFGLPYKIKTFENGLKAAVIGVTTQYIPNWEKKQHIENITFESAVSSLKRWIPYVQEEEKPDLIIVSYHGGFERDLRTGEKTEEQTGENEAYRICTEVPGIDVLITGHQHRFLEGIKINGVAVVQPGFNGQALAKVTVKFKKKHNDWLIDEKRSTLISAKEAAADEEILHIAGYYESKTQKWLDTVIGEIDGDMLINDIFEARLKEHPLIEFINKVQMEAAGADISCTALFHEGAPGLSHQVTMGQIVSNYIYPNSLSVLRVSGKDIKDALERSASYFELNDEGQIIVNPDFSFPKPQHYNYDMWEGIQYVIDVSRAAGDRVKGLQYKGRPVEEDTQYKVVMNNYRAAGGGGYTMFKDKPVVKEIQTDMAELLANYFLEKKEIKPSLNHNWRVLAGE
ncbi:2',3'-cyclic-nucleotide 2'-phosphodiesterase/3'-nucleotidase [Cytobacillus oceanisediminis]|uniref:2',3'-cyclic-nucleotide 2'-phosphodiesterase/3'-nucleotidase n=1 Tax=Cytobacillus oceanisediminis TaxID=665099 RepID=A0A2V2ZJ35_9BACI|nr:bifunctional UDP-sugar hydrolase/5'-nucleotidase [Cytobacillus oceanisediminis]PWW19898.1 2',3'-cyclic-nucleotide 2'-phosphodiesterase/3'-nucleotidase [Cytobacillus oceanisediminis]